MAKSVDLTTGQEAGQMVIGLGTQRSEDASPDRDSVDHTASVADTVGAMYMLNTTVGSLYDYGRTRSEARVKPDPLFNQFSYFQRNRDAITASLPDAEAFVRSGHYDHVASPEEFDAVTHQIARELWRRDIIGRSSTIGLIAGMALSFADVSTIIPIIGWAGKAGIAAKMAVGALGAGATAAAQEGVLQSLQETRTAGESIENIGIATLLGGGLGAFYKAGLRGNTLNYRHPENPLKLGTMIPEGSTIGAAEVTRRAVQYGDDTSLGPIDSIGYWLKTPTSVAHAVSKVDGETAALLEDLSHTGIVTRANEAGIASRESADELAQFYELSSINVLRGVDETYRALNGELGSATALPLRDAASQLPGIRGLVTPPDMTRADFNRHLFMRLNDPAYTTGNAIVDRHVTEGAANVRAFLDAMLNKGKELRLFDSAQGLDNYFVQRWVSHRIAENPAELEAFLLRKFSREPDDEWMRQYHGMTADEFKALPTTDPRVKSILEDWNVETEASRLRLLEKEAEASEATATASLYKLKADFAEARKSNTRSINADLVEVAAEARVKEAELIALRSKREQLRLEHSALTEAAAAARTQGLAHKLAFESGDDVPTPGSTLGKLEDALGITHETKVIPRTPDTASAAARAREVARQLRSVDEQVAMAERRLERLTIRAGDVASKASTARIARKAAADALRIAKENARKAGRAARSTSSRLQAAEARQSIVDRAADITRTLQNRGEVPSGLLLFEKGSGNLIATSGRALARGLKLTPGELAEAVSRGWIDTDVSSLMQAYSRDVGGRLALLEKFGSVDLEAQVRAVQDRFATLKATASSASERDKLNTMEARSLTAVRTLRNRVLGIDGIPSDPESALLYFGRVARMTNFLRFMGGTMLSSMTDIATTSLSAGGTGKLLRSLGKSVKRHAAGMQDEEVRSMLFGMENVMAFSRAAKLNLGDDLQFVRGFGEGATRRASSAFENGLRFLSERMGLLNGQAWWNSRLRYVAGQIQMQNVLEDAKLVRAGGELAEHRVTEYARFGVDLDDLRGIATQIEKHGEVNEAGLIDPNGGAWFGEAGGDALHRKLLLLLKRSTQEAVINPTAGDLPPFMTTAAGRMLMQFQSFGFAAVNKYARNLRYKAVNGQAWDAVLSATLALAMGAGVYAIKVGGVNGEKLSDKPGDWVYESLDRSGLMLYLMPYVASGIKLASPALQSAGVDVLSLPSRYRQSSWLTGFLGPTFSLMEDVQGAGSSLATGDVDRATEKMKRLLPFQNLWYLDAAWSAANDLSDDDWMK